MQLQLFFLIGLWKNILIFPKFSFKKTDNLSCYLLLVISLVGVDSF